jgi:ribosomal protein S5
MDPDLVDVQKERRLVVSGRIFDIRAATTIGRRRGIELVTLAGSRLVEDPL